jgi:hypothetical protein
MKEILKMAGKFVFIVFLVEAGWLLHLLEAISQTVVKSKKGWNKRAAGAGTIASLVADPVNRMAKKGRMRIKNLLNPYSLGSFI